MNKKKIVFLCHFSNQLVREKLKLNKDILRQLVYYLKGSAATHDDFAIWVSDYISEFEKHPEVEVHIVAPFYGMKYKKQSFEYNGICYHFFRSNYGFSYSVLDKYIHIQEKDDYKRNREKISSIINIIDPDIIILCGAENPYYSLGVLDIKEIPVYVILQTLLNDSKRIKMGVGSPYRRKAELDVFRHARYFSTMGKQEIDVIKRVNNEAVFLPVGFPTHRPIVPIPERKDFDFVFFARIVTKNKGIEDLLQALSIVKNTYEGVRLNIIGGIKDDYKESLKEIIQKMNISKNVHFSGYYMQIKDTYENVAKASAAVVPGITAGLNSTVRESMLMGLPTICYKTPASEAINKETLCLITAKMEDVEDLARQMIYVLDHPKLADSIALNGKEYSEREFNNTAIVNKLLDNCQLIIEKKV